MWKDFDLANARERKIVGWRRIAVDETGLFQGIPCQQEVIVIILRDQNRNIFISAGMHGDEINGIELLQRFLHRFDAKKLAGTVIFLPVLNAALEFR